MQETTRIVGTAELAQHMGWTPGSARTMTSLARVRREADNVRPGDLPPPDGHETRRNREVPWWYTATIDAWDLTRPTALREARNRPDGLKVCSKCGDAKPVSEYHTYADRRPGRHGDRRPIAKCKTCHMLAADDWNQRNPERKDAAQKRWKKKTKRKYKARLYGLTEVELAAMEAAQQGICLICGEFAEAGLRVDHDHATGAVRGLLCNACNLGLGAFRDNPLRLLRAARYLRKTRSALVAEPD